MNRNQFVHIYISITFPLILFFSAILSVFDNWFVMFEYNRSTFPADPYGFNNEERLRYGCDSLQYIRRNMPDSTLARLSFADGTPLYNERELSHMRDVKNVFNSTKSVWMIILLSYLAVLFGFRKSTSTLSAFFSGIKSGSIAVIALMLVVLILVVFAFDPLFAAFHGLFFSSGTWLFYSTDSLIRLYPEQLWIDGFSAVGALTIFYALLCFLITKSLYKQIEIKKHR